MLRFLVTLVTIAVLGSAWSGNEKTRIGSPAFTSHGAFALYFMVSVLGIQDGGHVGARAEIALAAFDGIWSAVDRARNGRTNPGIFQALRQPGGIREPILFGLSSVHNPG
jgi:hypothetical protein